MKTGKIFIYFSLLCTLCLSIESSMATQILFVGDSHSAGSFGRFINENLRTLENVDVTTVGSCGAKARHYLNGHATHCGFYMADNQNRVTSATKHATPLMTDLLAKLQPQFVLVELAGNYTDASDEYTVRDMRELAQKIYDSGAKCLWIGAADSRDRTRIPRLYKLMHEAVSELCHQFDSTLVTTYPTTGGDGVHYAGEEGRVQTKRWADAVLTEFVEWSGL